MKYLILLLVIFSSPLWAQNKSHTSTEEVTKGTKKPKKFREIPSVEIQAKLIRHTPKYLYMESETEKFQIENAKLTKEGVKQIKANVGNTLTLFVPENSIVDRSPKEKKP